MKPRRRPGSPAGVGDDLAHDASLAVGEPGPVARDRRVELEHAPLDQHQQAHGDEPLGAGEDQLERVALPRRPRPVVGDRHPRGRRPARRRRRGERRAARLRPEDPLELLATASKPAATSRDRAASAHTRRRPRAPPRGSACRRAASSCSRPAGRRAPARPARARRSGPRSSPRPPARSSGSARGCA